MKFSERYGYVKPRDVIQIDSMDGYLRNRLWNVLTIDVWSGAPLTKTDSGGYGSYSIAALDKATRNQFNSLIQDIWINFLKHPIDELNNNWNQVLKNFKEMFYLFSFYEVYDFLEFIALSGENKLCVSTEFTLNCNVILESEMSAYRFVNSNIAQITSEIELQEIEEATINNDPVSEHLRMALSKLSDRKKPDYRNSIKESVSALESLAKQLLDTKSGTLSGLLEKLAKETKIHPALKNGLKNIYGYTSDEEGIRHALTDKSYSTFEDAKFMLVMCSSFVNYIKSKSLKK